MIKHVVFFRFKPGAEEPAREAMAEGLASLQGQIPQIRAWAQGENVLPSERNYDFCLVGDFDSLDHLQIYQDHPAHQHVIATLIRPVVESVVVVDFES